MQPLRAFFCYFAFSCLAPASAETIIGFDGKEHKYPTHRDGLHDPALRHLHHVSTHEVDAHQLQHMLNQKPIIVSQRNLHIVKRDSSLHVSRRGFGVGTSAEFQSAGKASRLGSHTSRQDIHFHGGYDQHQRNIGAQGSLANDLALAPSAAVALGPAPFPAPMGGPGPSAYPPMVMDEDSGAPEQGFEGETVEHNNMKTMTKDWHTEYGPGAAGVQSYVEICALYPDNKWCHLHGYHRSTPQPSASVQVARISTTLTLMLVACGILFA